LTTCHCVDYRCDLMALPLVLPNDVNDDETDDDQGVAPLSPHCYQNYIYYLRTHVGGMRNGAEAATMNEMTMMDAVTNDAMVVVHGGYHSLDDTTMPMVVVDLVHEDATVVLLVVAVLGMVAHTSVCENSKRMDDDDCRIGHRGDRAGVLEAVVPSLIVLHFHQEAVDLYWKEVVLLRHDCMDHSDKVEKSAMTTVPQG
jgi:hypothetical protein